MSVIKLAEKVKSVLKERGWCQGRIVNMRGEVCLIGALRCAAGGSPDAELGEVGYRLFQALSDVIPAASPADWNDAQGRTVEEVNEMIDQAAALLAGES